MSKFAKGMNVGSGRAMLSVMVTAGYTLTGNHRSPIVSPGRCITVLSQKECSFATSAIIPPVLILIIFFLAHTKTIRRTWQLKGEGGKARKSIHG